MHLFRLRTSAMNRTFGMLTQWGLRLSLKRLREPNAIGLLEARGVPAACRDSIVEADRRPSSAAMPAWHRASNRPLGTGALSKAGSRTLRWAAIEAAQQAWRPTNPWHGLYLDVAKRHGHNPPPSLPSRARS